MDVTETILLTALVNIVITGLISGVAIYRIKRGIDISFDQKLEKFKADLAYSNFQQQRNFVRVYEKRVEIIKTLYQKFKLFSDEQTRWVINVIESKEKNEPVDPAKQGENVPSIFNDFVVYFDENRHELPDGINREIDRMVESAEYWIKMVAKLLFSEHDPVNARGSAYMVYRLAEELEQLYKSEADITLDNRRIKAA